jgi:putative FmdB family regulatory protein
VPAYDYLCDNCGHRFEVVHGVHAEGPTVCPSCGARRLRKAIVAPAVHFKGSGWAKKERRSIPVSAGSASGEAPSDRSDAADAGKEGDGTKPSTDGERGAKIATGSRGEKDRSRDKDSSGDKDSSRERDTNRHRDSSRQKGSDGDPAAARSSSSEGPDRGPSRTGSNKAAVSGGDN